MSEITINEIIEKSIDLYDLMTQTNTDGCSSGNYTYSISLGISSRGARVDILVGAKRFSDVLSRYPVGTKCEYSRVSVSKLSTNSYHVSYILPSFDNKVNLTAIVNSYEDLSNLLGDVINHVNITENSR